MYIFQTYQNSIATIAAGKKETSFFTNWNDCGSYTNEVNIECFGGVSCDSGVEIVSKF